MKGYFKNRAGRVRENESFCGQKGAVQMKDRGFNQVPKNADASGMEFAYQNWGLCCWWMMKIHSFVLENTLIFSVLWKVNYNI